MDGLKFLGKPAPLLITSDETEGYPTCQFMVEGEEGYDENHEEFCACRVEHLVGAIREAATTLENATGFSSEDDKAFSEWLEKEGINDEDFNGLEEYVAFLLRKTIGD